MWYDRTSDQPDCFENDGFRVRHASSVFQTDEPSRGLDFVDLSLSRSLYVRSGDQVAQDLNKEISDCRVTSYDIFQGEHRHVPGHTGLGVSLDMIDKTVYVVLFGYDRPPVGQTVSDDVSLHEFPNPVAPVSHSRHISLVQRHQERHEVGGVALIHLVEHLVEVLDHRAERAVSQIEAPRAEVTDKDVRARVQNQRLGVQGGARHADQVINQELHFGADNVIQLIVSRGASTRKGVRT